jgi:hypothetical protein
MSDEKYVGLGDYLRDYLDRARQIPPQDREQVRARNPTVIAGTTIVKQQLSDHDEALLQQSFDHPLPDQRPLPPLMESPRADGPRSRPIARSRWTSRNDGTPSTPFAIGALAFACALWGIGGYFSLDALRLLGVPVSMTMVVPTDAETWRPWLWWLIPVGVSLIEFQAGRLQGTSRMIWWFVAGFDLLSTFFGLREWIDGRIFYGLVGHGTLSVENIPTLVALGILAWVLTFQPEKGMAEQYAVLSARAP